MKNKKIFILIVVLCILCGLFFVLRNDNSKDDVLFELREGLNITEIKAYSGPYLEDGSNEQVNNVLMIKVTNTTDSTLQYTDITLRGETKNAYFSLSTLPAHESIYVIENQKLQYDDENYFNAYVSNIVFFEDSISMYNDRLEIDALDGMFNITNISNDDINGIIYVYYKNYIDDKLVGGITYRAKVEGLKAGEIRQVRTNHYTKDSSRLMFVSIGE